MGWQPLDTRKRKGDRHPGRQRVTLNIYTKVGRGLGKRAVVVRRGELRPLAEVPAVDMRLWPFEEAQPFVLFRLHRIKWSSKYGERIKRLAAECDKASCALS